MKLGVFLLVRITSRHLIAESKIIEITDMLIMLYNYRQRELETLCIIKRRIEIHFYL